MSQFSSKRFMVECCGKPATFEVVIQDNGDIVLIPKDKSAEHLIKTNWYLVEKKAKEALDSLLKKWAWVDEYAAVINFAQAHIALDTSMKSILNIAPQAHSGKKKKPLIPKDVREVFGVRRALEKKVLDVLTHKEEILPALQKLTTMLTIQQRFDSIRGYVMKGWSEYFSVQILYDTAILMPVTVLVANPTNIPTEVATNTRMWWIQLYSPKRVLDFLYDIEKGRMNILMKKAEKAFKNIEEDHFIPSGDEGTYYLVKGEILDELWRRLVKVHSAFKKVSE